MDFRLYFSARNSFALSLNFLISLYLFEIIVVIFFVTDSILCSSSIQFIIPSTPFICSLVFSN